MKLVIGNKNYSSWSFRPWIAMKVAGLPFDEEVISLYVEGSREKILKHSPGGKVPIQAGRGRIQRAVLEPLDRDVAGKAGVLDLRRRVHPRDAARLLGPESIRIARGVFEHALVARGGDVCLRA